MPYSYKLDESEDQPRNEQHHLVRRVVFMLALLVLVVFALVKAKGILLPIVFAALFAMLFDPVVDWMAKKVSRSVAIGALVFTFFSLTVGLFLLAGSQIADFSSDLPAIQDKASELIEDAQTWVSNQLNISESHIEKRVEQKLEEAPELATARAKSWAGTLTGFLADLLLFFVYLILMLASRERFQRFVLKLTPTAQRLEAEDTLSNVRKVAGHYLWGRAILISILAVVYFAGFTWAGLNYAIVVALLGAALSIIPYFGNMVAAALVLVIAAFSQDAQSTMLICLGTMVFAQIIESYVLEPLIVGGEVDLNPLTTVVAVVAFSSMWGIAGAILALPLVGVLRQVLAALPRGEAWAYLLSNEK